MELKDKKVLVVGAGKSGVAVSHFLVKKGAAVVLADANEPADANELLRQMTAERIELFLGGYPEVKKTSFDLLVMSPGVPLSVEPARAAEYNGIPVIGELELAYRFAQVPIVAITGTNGKTTTTALVGAILQDAGLSVLVGGNIGLPLVSEIENYSTQDVVVAEVSSFQLETTKFFKPKVGVILNITPDHLDRHGDMDKYIAAKAKILANQEGDDFLVLNYDDPMVVALGTKARSKIVYFSRCGDLTRGVFVSEGKIVAKLGERTDTICSVHDLSIPGTHNLENALAAVVVAKIMGVSNDRLAATLRSFKGVAHRLEFVVEIDGVSYINDSKGTNPDASLKALEAYNEPIVLIAGGYNKGSDFSQLAEKFREKVRVLVVLGQSAELIADAAQKKNFTNIQVASDFPEAVNLACRAARPGDVVLLSPACASWDMFKNFEERGELFKKIVLNLSNQ